MQYQTEQNDMETRQCTSYMQKTEHCVEVNMNTTCFGVHVAQKSQWKAQKLHNFGPEWPLLCRHPPSEILEHVAFLGSLPSKY